MPLPDNHPGYIFSLEWFEGNIALGLISEYVAGMEEKRQPPQQVPLVPMNGPTLAANVAFVEYVRGNGAIMLNLADQRLGPIQTMGDKPQEAFFELGRFMLTPRALRQLIDAAAAAAKAYEETAGEPLPTQDQFIARAAMTTLIPPPFLKNDGDRA